MKKRYSLGSTILTCVFILVCLAWIFPIMQVLINSFKTNAAVSLNPFTLPDAESFAGFDNYTKGLTFGNYPFLKSAAYSLLITVVSVALILLFCSMSAWYIARVDSTSRESSITFACFP